MPPQRNKNGNDEKLQQNEATIQMGNKSLPISNGRDCPAILVDEQASYFLMGTAPRACDKGLTLELRVSTLLKIPLSRCQVNSVLSVTKSRHSRHLSRTVHIRTQMQMAQPPWDRRHRDTAYRGGLN